MRKSLLILALCSLPIFVWSQKYQETENGIKTSINEKKIGRSSVVHSKQSENFKDTARKDCRKEKSLRYCKAE